MNHALLGPRVPSVQFARPMRTAFIAALVLILFGATARAQDDTEFQTFIDGFQWKTSGTGALGARAEIDVPLGYRFIDGEQTSRFLEGLGNISSREELGLIGDVSLEWFVVFFFDDIGYVKDDEKDDLDAQAMAETVRNGLVASNQYRREQGIEEMFFDGWEVEPRFNASSKQLEWASRLRSASGTSINYNTRVLGRKGVMRVILVTDEGALQEVMPAYQRVMQGFRFMDGERYAQYTSGDKVAQYGLIALVAGGAGAVAMKTGLLASLAVFFKKGFKFILIGLVAVGAFIKRLFTGRSARA
mgnify:CR=1 FL=1